MCKRSVNVLLAVCSEVEKRDLVVGNYRLAKQRKWGMKMDRYALGLAVILVWVEYFWGFRA